MTLKGRVDSPRERDLCVSCCHRVAGVLHVVDELRMCDGDQVSAVLSCDRASLL